MLSHTVVYFVVDVVGIRTPQNLHTISFHEVFILSVVAKLNSRQQHDG